ncbi:MAG: hypothetical protein ACN4GT_07700 [Gammaproteobacteria bacterium]
MEWIPKLYDNLDSLAFEFRMRWAGHVGANFRALLLLVLVLGLSAVSSVFRNTLIALVGAAMLFEISGAKLGRGRLLRLAGRRKAAV